MAAIARAAIIGAYLLLANGSADVLFNHGYDTQKPQSYLWVQSIDLMLGYLGVYFGAPVARIGFRAASFTDPTLFLTGVFMQYWSAKRPIPIAARLVRSCAASLADRNWARTVPALGTLLFGVVIAASRPFIVKAMIVSPGGRAYRDPVKHARPSRLARDNTSALRAGARHLRFSAREAIRRFFF